MGLWGINHQIVLFAIIQIQHYPSRRGDTYLFHCPRQTCSMGSVTIHNLIKDHGGSDLFERWRETRWRKEKPYGWKGIKNRRQ